MEPKPVRYERTVTECEVHDSQSEHSTFGVDNEISSWSIESLLNVLNDVFFMKECKYLIVSCNDRMFRVFEKISLFFLMRCRSMKNGASTYQLDTCTRFD